MSTLRVYATRENGNSVVYRATLNNGRDHAGMLFTTYDDLINFILMVPTITYVAVLIHVQSTIPYPQRLDDVILKDAVRLAQATRKGRKRDISFGCE